MNPHCIPCIFTLVFRCHQRCSPDHDNMHMTACFFYDHDATSSVRAHRLVITSTGELSKKEVNMFAKKVKAPQENSAPALKKPLILFARSPFPFLVPVISYYFLFLVFFLPSTPRSTHSIPYFTIFISVHPVAVPFSLLLFFYSMSTHFFCRYLLPTPPPRSHFH